MTGSYGSSDLTFWRTFLTNFCIGFVVAGGGCSDQGKDNNRICYRGLLFLCHRLPQYGGGTWESATGLKFGGGCFAGVTSESA